MANNTRKPTPIEVFYIQHNTHLTAKELSKTLYGVHPRYIQKVLDEVKEKEQVASPADQSTLALEVQAAEIKPPELTPEQQTIASLQSQITELTKKLTAVIKNDVATLDQMETAESPFKAGDLFIRDGSGAVVMSQAASELSDARRTLAIKNNKPKNTSQIHTIKKK